jgi:hypothetical protein
MPNVVVDEAPVNGLVMRPDLALHCKVLHWVEVILWVLYLAGVPAVAIVGLNCRAHKNGKGPC